MRSFGAARRGSRGKGAAEFAPVPATAQLATPHSAHSARSYSLHGSAFRRRSLSLIHCSSGGF